jgi:hypothetical protein
MRIVFGKDGFGYYGYYYCRGDNHSPDCVYDSDRYVINQKLKDRFDSFVYNYKNKTFSFGDQADEDYFLLWSELGVGNKIIFTISTTYDL